MVRPGKEPAAAAADDASQVTTQEGRWRAGVNRQSQPAAAEHQRAAGLASGAKRKERAMSKEESLTKKAKHKREVRAANAAAKAAAATATPSAFDAAFDRVASAAALGDTERCDFYDWLLRVELPPDDESLGEWRDSDEYQRIKLERIAEGCVCDGVCACTYDGEGMVPDVPGVNCDYYEENVTRADDWQPSGGDWVPEGWDEPDRVDEASPPPPAPPPPAPPPPLPPPPAAVDAPLPQGLHAAGEPMPMPLAEFKALLQQMTKAQLEERMEALGPFMDAATAEERRALAESPEKARLDELYAPYRGRIATCVNPKCTGCTDNWQHDAAVEAAYQAERRLAQQLHDQRPQHLWDEHLHIYNEILDRRRCKGCGFFGCQCTLCATGSEATASQPVSQDEGDAYELDQERQLEEQGRVSAIHGRPWHEVPFGATEAAHWLDYVRRPFERFTSAFRSQPPQRPLSPAPVATDFETEEEFLQERARWFREHGDGDELHGATRREQNNIFQRLRDRLFGLRRARANPSGTPRALQGSASGAGSSTDP